MGGGGWYLGGEGWVLRGHAKYRRDRVRAAGPPDSTGEVTSLSTGDVRYLTLSSLTGCTGVSHFRWGGGGGGGGGLIGLQTVAAVMDV